MGKGVLYVDYLSQPCRALATLIKVGKLDVELKVIDLLKGEHKTEEYKKTHPFSKVPTLKEDDGWILTESVAIVRYLCATQKLDAYWYPSDPRARARVDEFLAWYHTGIRKAAMGVFLPVSFVKVGTGKVDTEALKSNLQELDTTLTQFQTIFLKGQKFVTGKQISVADLFGANEVTQMMSTGYDVKKHYPDVAAWVERVRAETKPHMDDFHKSINNFGGQHKYDYEPLIAKKN